MAKYCGMTIYMYTLYQEHMQNTNNLQTCSACFLIVSYKIYSHIAICRIWLYNTQLQIFNIYLFYKDMKMNGLGITTFVHSVWSLHFEHRVRNTSERKKYIAFQSNKALCRFSIPAFSFIMTVPKM